jgi:hypothetical protein
MQINKIYKVNSPKADFVYISDIIENGDTVKYRIFGKHKHREFRASARFVESLIESEGMSEEEVKEEYPEFFI